MKSTKGFAEIFVEVVLTGIFAAGDKPASCKQIV